MKRKIVVEIDCEEKGCEPCPFNDYEEYGIWCPLFSESTASGKRVDSCRLAEREYNELKNKAKNWDFRVNSILSKLSSGNSDIS